MITTSGGGGGISGLATGQNVVATSPTTIGTDGVKRYVALLTQTGGDAPVVTELFNTLGGTPTVARVSDGIYTLTRAGAFTAKTAIKPMGVLPVEGFTHRTAAAARISDNVIEIHTANVTVDVGNEEVHTNHGDDILSNTLIDITVYPN